VLAYLTFFGAFLYAIGFVGNWLVPKSIDSGHAGPVTPSLLINGAILAAFVLQHTIMARPGFKRAWTRIIPKQAERSTYVLLASAILLVLFWQWRPLPTILWQTTSPGAAWALSAISLLGWATVLAASCMVSHLDLFGLRQSWLAFRGRTYRPVGFRLVGLYKLVRHPLMLGFLIAFWSTPTMTTGHLFFAIMTTAYILMGIWFEERDLVREHRDSYLEYRRTTPALIPIPRRADQ
jgi:protein-S-isoprenylcysteine O-methyltransferase Ste14